MTDRSRLLVVDSCVIMHFLKDGPEHGQEAIWEDCQRLMETREEGWELAIAPSAYAELLHGCDPELIEALSTWVDRTFRFLTFDKRAAHLCGLMLREHWKTLRKGTPRPLFKVDAEILATAVRWGVGGLCTVDDGMRDFACAVDASIEVGSPRSFRPRQEPLPVSGKPSRMESSGLTTQSQVDSANHPDTP